MVSGSVTTCCLKQLPEFESRSKHVKKLPVTWYSTVVLPEFFSFLHHLQLASHNLNLNYNGLKSDSNQNSKIFDTLSKSKAQNYNTVMVYCRARLTQRH